MDVPPRQLPPIITINGLHLRYHRRAFWTKMLMLMLALWKDEAPVDLECARKIIKSLKHKHRPSSNSSRRQWMLPTIYYQTLQRCSQTPSNNLASNRPTVLSKPYPQLRWELPCSTLWNQETVCPRCVISSKLKAVKRRRAKIWRMRLNRSWRCVWMHTARVDQRRSLKYNMCRFFTHRSKSSMTQKWWKAC